MHMMQHMSNTKETTTAVAVTRHPSNSSSTNTSTTTTTLLHRKVVYISIILTCIGTICLSTTKDDTSILWYVLLQYHEPSIRIIRCSIEITILLLGTAISIFIFQRYLCLSQPHHDDENEDDVLHQLLFQSSDNNPMNQVGIDDSNYYSSDNNKYNNNNNNNNKRLYESDLFAPVVNDMLGEDGSDDKDHEHEGEDKGDSTRHCKDHESLLDNHTSYDSNQHSQSKSTTKVDRQQRSTLPIAILCLAGDLFLYTIITFLLYFLSAIYTVQQQQLQQASGSKMNSSHDNSTTLVTRISTMAVAPTFPLLFVIACTIQLIRYYQHYQELYRIISYTFYAPFYTVTFRDGTIVRIKAVFRFPFCAVYVFLFQCALTHTLNIFIWNDPCTFIG
jgi:hypothetical protein